MEKLKRIYEKAEKAVCEIADIELDKFLTSHEEKYVDMSQQRINSLKNGFIRRKQKMSVDLFLQETNKQLTNSLQITI